jgi:very-short-patch-repair endonuclease
VIEADGPFHEVEKDEARDAWLVANGFRVLRLTNREVGGGRDHLFARIIEMVAEPARPRKF